MMFPLIFTESWVYCLIGPFLFGVSSTFETGISFFSFTSGSQCFFANCSSIKAPLAPQSISTLVSMIFFPSIISVLTFIVFELLFGTLQIVRALMESSLEGLDVIASLLTEYPLVLQLILNHSLSRHSKKAVLLLLNLCYRVLS